ncbi:unnamed protein product [Rotaria magnacalcarata]|uniref:Uncharacterized protein n=1 Tax=Rotaria magnacalcarata TaxID=392030 RepID=A0A819ZNA0_9BILA|nr:unnamed protein product [Rotaria magnacalcarata]CAF4171038.1 unnamed protein product [Rotaria magnacalcarata]
MSVDNSTNSVVPHKLTVYEYNKLHNKLKFMNRPNTNNTSRPRLPPKMSEAKADWLRQILNSRILDKPITSGAKCLKEPIAFQSNPCESIISNLSKLSRGLRNRVIKEYINNNPIVDTLTCPHPSGYYRNVLCPYCRYGNAEVVKIEKLTRYFICKFRLYKQQFRGIKNLAKNKIIPPKSESTVPLELSNTNNSDSEIESSESLDNNNTVTLELLVHSNNINESEPISTTVNNDMQPPLSVAPTNDIKEIESPKPAITNPEQQTGTVKVTNTPYYRNLYDYARFLADGCYSYDIDHSHCNGEPYEDQADLVDRSCYTGVNLWCPKQAPFRLEGKYINFLKHNTYLSGWERENKYNIEYCKVAYENKDDRSVSKYAYERMQEIAEMYGADDYSLNKWIVYFRVKLIPEQEEKEMIMKRIDYELALDNLFTNKPNATLQDVSELYKQHSPFLTKIEKLKNLPLDKSKN